MFKVYGDTKNIEPFNVKRQFRSGMRAELRSMRDWGRVPLAKDIASTGKTGVVKKIQPAGVTEAAKMRYMKTFKE